ncbi:MAG: putative tail protein [Prokaryotic dsDNA virus sp.]|mgnify:FL=1|jgi:uncharacterized phage protein (TIGR02218 family)|nr:MAG: putative tail protein [Prokaryotic dsDNA virus sp.]|tara:strand:- start:11327 stop:12790 length:1464 start_codon:yes stop_codon:yes gene_type:complete
MTKDISTALQDHLNSGTTTMVHCWKLTRDVVAAAFFPPDFSGALLHPLNVAGNPAPNYSGGVTPGEGWKIQSLFANPDFENDIVLDPYLLNLQDNSEGYCASFDIDLSEVPLGTVFDFSFLQTNTANVGTVVDAQSYLRVYTQADLDGATLGGLRVDDWTTVSSIDLDFGTPSTYTHNHTFTHSDPNHIILRLMIILDNKGSDFVNRQARYDTLNMTADPSLDGDTTAVLGFTECDIPLTFDDLTYEPTSGFTASKVDASLGLAVDNLEVEGIFRSDAITEEALARGDFDGATVDLYWVNFEDVSQRTLLSSGTLGEIRRTEFGFTTEIRSKAQKMQQQTGRLYSKTCDAVFGDERCGYNVENATSGGSVVSSTGDRVLTTTGVSDDENDVYTFGLLTFTSGQNSGKSFEVKNHTTGRVALWEKTPFPIADGDTFSIRQGCNKYASTCASKFSNIRNFRGFNYIPGSDTLTRSAKKDGSQKGQSIYK